MTAVFTYLTWFAIGAAVGMGVMAFIAARKLKSVARRSRRRMVDAMVMAHGIDAALDVLDDHDALDDFTAEVNERINDSMAQLAMEDPVVADMMEREG